jgi:hypothetical protein
LRLRTENSKIERSRLLRIWDTEAQPPAGLDDGSIDSESRFVAIYRFTRKLTM